jgi:galactokinase
MPERAIESFRAHFGHAPQVVVRAPGRVNLLGGHTDYNEGYVLPAAIDRVAWVAAAPLAEPMAHLVALDLEEEARFPLEPVPPAEGTWADYARGVAWALAESGRRPVGMEALLTSDVPVGAGLSSSAAVEVAFAWAWRALSGFELGRAEAARIGRRAESDYVGVRCGIMDQMASAAGRAGHVLLLDCRTLEMMPIPLPPGAMIVVADSGVRRELAASAYNERREQCEAAARILSAYLPDVRALRDLTPGELARLAFHLPAELRKRARHVVHANVRVLESAEALRQGDVERLGAAMRRCHESLRDDYEVSSPELDLLAETAWGVEGCYGARLTGAGFGGCVVALVEENAVEELSAQLVRAYRGRFDRTPAIIPCRIADGVSVALRS